MKLEKWVQVAKSENRKMCDAFLSCGVLPENWARIRVAALAFVKAVDEMTEVYEMENKKEN